MDIKPWREIACPRKEVLKGNFKQSEFAADITLVTKGVAELEYRDAEQFFSRTYITAGMRLLLISVARRLVGHGGDPVIQLQTAFGGGKTHTLLAVYHLASSNVESDRLAGIPPILDEAGIQLLPDINVAVIDGIRLSPSQPRQYDGVVINTLWGELAWQLFGKSGYQMVAGSDVDGTSPGKEVLIDLIRKAAPCVILIDELVAFIRQLEPGKQLKAGTFDSNISFVQALTEAMKAVPNSILLATLPESDLEAGGTIGQQALLSLEKYFARVENIWKPVATEEAFEIVRRRLFETSGECAEVENVSRQFSDFYRQNARKFPVETQSSEYTNRICHSYPIHPEVFDRLFEDWSTLEKFQRTRGVLQYLAVVIHRLWNSGNRDLMIMPGSLPLEDGNVRNKSIHYLPPGWEPVIEREVDGTQSVPYLEIDGKDTRFGSVQAARRTARTIFLGSAPSTSEQMVRGIQIERILLGAVQPGQNIGAFEDVLKRLRDRLHHLYSEKSQYWFDTKPNLRREMESRMQNIDLQSELLPLLKSYVIQELGKKCQFGGVHVFTPSVDVPDDHGTGVRLVVLPINHYYSRSENNPAYSVAKDILLNRGNQPRQRRNRLIFLAPDYDVVSRLKNQGRIYHAWKSIVEDIQSGNLNHDVSHQNQAKRSCHNAGLVISQLVRETYKWLIVPTEESVKGELKFDWEVVSVSPTTRNLVKTVEEKLREEEWVIYDWSPIHLRSMLNQWYLKDDTEEVSALKVWQDSCRYLNMPRLANDRVFCKAIEQGVRSEDYFAYASGKEGDQFLGFAFGDDGKYINTLNEFSLLIDCETAVAYRERIQKQNSAPPDPTPSGNGTGTTGEPTPPPVPPVGATPKRFYGDISLNPLKARVEFQDIVHEIVDQFMDKTDVDVKISVEIDAKSSSGFDEGFQRVVKENCKVLHFREAEFEEE